MEKQFSYLSFYERCMITSEVPRIKDCLTDEGYHNGMCQHLPIEFQEIMAPDGDEDKELLNEGFCDAYWGSGLPRNHEDERKLFTPLRQTLILFMAAMNGEL